MKDIQLIVVGGFLGAGKTTALLELAQRLQAQGKRVAAITNDQSPHLVDSALVERRGLPVEEVTSGCFCCNFHDFADRLQTLCEKERPDVILAEPVGSCTDLLSTIMKPLRQERAGSFGLAPLTVVVEPQRLQALRAGGPNHFGREEVPYLFSKQLEEADVLLLNKCDLLTPDRRADCVAYLEENYPQAKVLCASAREGEGVAQWLALLDQRPAFDQSSPAIDYDTYAAAEAALGWLNARVTLRAPEGCDAGALLLELAESLRLALRGSNSEIAHLKAGATDASGDLAKVSCVSMESPASLDVQPAQAFCDFRLILNVRAACQPDTLQAAAQRQLQMAAQAANAEILDCQIACFAPSYPNPVYRL